MITQGLHRCWRAAAFKRGTTFKQKYRASDGVQSSELQQLKDFNWTFQAGYGYGLGVRVMMSPNCRRKQQSRGRIGWAGLAGTWTMMEPEEGLSAV
jgi:CubicO group peptidase (beta-lactamase class C family)